MEGRVRTYGCWWEWGYFWSRNREFEPGQLLCDMENLGVYSAMTGCGDFGQYTRMQHLESVRELSIYAYTYTCTHIYMCVEMYLVSWPDLMILF